jgi:carboxyl-terminal processing protease
MALKQFFNLFIALVLFSCSFEQEEKINYEDEFYSIVSEFERSSILNFDRKDIDKDIFIEQFTLKLDKQKNTFLQEDLNAFRKNRKNQTNSVYQELKDVIDLYYLRYEESLKTRRKYLNNFEFNFNKNEKINLKPRDSFFQNKKEKQDHQRRIVKNELINLLLEDKDKFEAKSELKKIYTNRLSSISKIRESDRFGILANNFLSMLDPHASYFSKRDLENWNLRMNLSFQGIGAILSYEEEKAKIQELMPGGPAIQSKKIKVGDKIIKVGQGERGRLRNVIGWRLDDIVELIRGEEGTTVRLEIENIEGKEIVNLTRGTVTLENSDASSEVIEFDDRKVGYIKLPSFYSDYDCLRRNLYVCKTATSDIQKLLREFNFQDIEGIVLDLRNNGGGYLHEADSLTRLFINYGPTVQVKNPSKEVEILHSWRSTKVWEKPLIVLVNKYSASASEIFAGAMQDYNRAIIIGQTTFGKGSVQRFKSTNNGQIKFTDSLYYRITGLPTQLSGVEPNLLIPSLINDETLGEGGYENAIKPSNIDDAYFVTFENFNSELLENSFQKRISSSDYFNKINEIKKQRESNLFLSLNLDERKLIEESDRNSTLELVNFARTLSGKDKFVNFSEYEDYVTEDEFVMDAEIDQSLRVLVELIELES